jgi:DNA-binding GntR family transcriptional regulator
MQRPVEPKLLLRASVDWIVHEAPFDLNRRGTRRLRLFERLDSAPSSSCRFGRQLRIRALDVLHLRRVDDNPALEPELSGAQRVLDETLEVLEIEIGAVERGPEPRRARRDDDPRPGIEEFGRIGREIDSDVDREVTETENERQRSRRRHGRDLLAANETSCRFHQSQQLDMSFRQPALPLKFEQQRIKLRQRLAVLDLRNHETIQINADDRADVFFQSTGLGTVHTDEHRLGSPVGRQRGADSLPCLGFLGVRDSVLEVEHDCVGAEPADLFDLARVVSGGEEERPKRVLLPADQGSAPSVQGDRSYILFSMAVAPRHLTKTEVALESLRERIRSGQLRPGERLRVDELTRELGMSPTPIREALRLEEVYGLRALLEPLAVELALTHLTDEDMQELERLHERHRNGRAKRATAVSEANRAWHWAIYESSDWPILTDIIRQLWEVFPWRTMWALPGRRPLSLEQHEQIMEAIRARDADLAAERMRVHITSGCETLLEHLRSRLSQEV